MDLVSTSSLHARRTWSPHLRRRAKRRLAGEDWAARGWMPRRSILHKPLARARHGLPARRRASAALAGPRERMALCVSLMAHPGQPGRKFNDHCLATIFHHFAVLSLASARANDV